ncbi:MAG TPA: isochorismatase family cysteine hydrolase [Candidatus Binatia bacterium]|nr:isochorismatase family cysteine hydrolase [Candidatus Binatia bacterium]
MTDKPPGLREPITQAAHLCVDMQRMFAEDTDWKTPWMKRVLPRVEQIAEAHAAETLFTRFVPAANAQEAKGRWRQYWKRWSTMTLDCIAPDLVELVPTLRRFVPPASVVDKRLYSPWVDTSLDDRLRARLIETLVVTGAETDVCVLASVLGAVDLGYRVIVVSDAICSSSDETHDALMTLYHQRYSQQIETAMSADVLAAWR